jgi:hypothetical protein
MPGPAPELANVRMHDGLRMTTPATTWAMLGAELTVRELVTLGDSFVRIPATAAAGFSRASASRQSHSSSGPRWPGGVWVSRNSDKPSS